MNEHTNRILQRALSLLVRYRDHKVGLASLVSSLEGSLLALEEKLPQAFYDAWYNHWGELEICLALNLENDKRDEILKDVEKLELLIGTLVSGK